MPDLRDRLTAALSDRYRIERELGEGGMATVYLAEDVKHHRNVALKVLKPELAAVVGAERFLTEIETTANLQHPHILPLFDSGEADSFLYYVMPYIEGESLRERLEREHQLPVEDALAIAQKVASALQYAHEQGVVHRDIKPANILLARGEPLVADFGIALAVSQAGGGRITETGLSLGTPHYMSPEQASGERGLDPRSDVYALACVLYEMLTGQPPFGGSSAQAVLAHILTGDPERPTTHRRSVPAHVEAAVLKGLERLPADRFGSAADFAAALKTPLAGATPEVPFAGGTIGAGARGAAGVGTTRPSTTSARRALPWGVAALAVAVAGASWLLRPASPAPRPMRVEVEPPPGVEFSEYRFGALSPDGTRLAFVGLRPTGGRVLWIRDLSTGHADSVHATSGAEAPFWSPDGRTMGYFARRGLWRIEVDGSAPRKLCDDADVGGDWSGRDVILFTRRGHPMTVAGGGGSCEPVPGVWADTVNTILEPAWLPDGDHFAGVDPESGGIVVSDLSGSVPKAFITLRATAVRFLAPDVAVFAKQGPKGADLVAQRFDPKTLTLVGTPTTLAEEVRTAGLVPSYTVAGTALVYLGAVRTDVGPLVADARGMIVDSVVAEGTWTMRRARSRAELLLGGMDVWDYDLTRRTSVAVGPSGAYDFPVWGPGDSVLVARRMDVGCPVVLMRPGTRTDTTLIDGEAQGQCLVPSDWTGDGRFLLLTSLGLPSAHGQFVSTQGEIWMYEMATGALEKILSVDGTASAGVVSPDLRWLAYVSNETGELQVYVRPFWRSGAAVRVSTEGGGLPRWRGDGRSLFYIAPDGRIMRVSVAESPALGLGVPQALFRAPRWSVRLFADQRGGVQLTTPYEVSPDGERFYLRQRTEETSAATLVLNWQTLLNSGGGPP